MSSLSLCMIVKNEEAVLERILKPVSQVMDAILIADTGSSDRTKEIAEQYVKEIFEKLRDYEYNEDLMKLYVMGGGAKMVEMFGKYNQDRTTFNHDICANAKGYEYFCYMMLRQKMRK